MSSADAQEIRMDEVQFRPVREEEIPESAQVFLTSVSDLAARLNLPPQLPPREYVEEMYRYIYRTGIFHVAEIDGKLVAICHAIVRDHIWFLSGFWALPHVQGRKIGKTLLKRIWDEGARVGANIFFTWSSMDMQAMGSYMKMGMLPGYQLLTFTGIVESLPDKRSGYDVEPLEVSTAVKVDEQLRGTGRETDHQFWLNELGLQGRQIRREGRIIGYYYFDKGTIAPAAWLEERDAQILLEIACREASAETNQIRLVIPGVNHAGLRFALSLNLRLTHYAHLLTTAPFGRMEQYLPSGPSLF